MMGRSRTAGRRVRPSGRALTARSNGAEHREAARPDGPFPGRRVAELNELIAAVADHRLGLAPEQDEQHADDPEHQKRRLLHQRVHH
jgi:hypothetical protein